MKRRQLLRQSIYCSSSLSLLGLSVFARGHEADVGEVKLTEAQWLEKLSERRYDILRLGDTESAGSSPLNKETRAGIYHCAGCDLPLFESK